MQKSNALPPRTHFGAMSDWRKPMVLSLSLKLNAQTVVNLVKSSQTDAVGRIAGNYDANTLQ
jgi:hypothetical protein